MIAVQSITLNMDGSWTFTWNSTDAYDRIVLWGQVLAKIVPVAGVGTYSYSGKDYQSYPPPLEIVPPGQQALSEQYSPILTIQWYGESCQQYLIQQNVSGVWITVNTFLENGQWIYTYITPILLDETTYSYRVIAVDAYGNQSVPRMYTRYVVTPPKLVETSLSLSYSKPNVVIAPA